jgi:hypothetical protein
MTVLAFKPHAIIYETKAELLQISTRMHNYTHSTYNITRKMQCKLLRAIYTVPAAELNNLAPSQANIFLHRKTA